MPTEVQMYSCPRCQRGQFRAFPGLNGKAYCPWCGDAVAPAESAAGPATDDPPLPELSLEELANRMSGGPPAAIATTSSTASPAPSPAPATNDLQARLAESERRRETAEAELQRELEKRQEIKKAVAAEISRLEAEVAEARNRVRRKDEEHAAALQTLNLLTDSKQTEFNGDRLRFQQAIDEKDKALKSLEAKLEERKASESDLRKMIDASRAEVGRLHAQVAGTESERADLRKKVADAEAKLASLKDAPAQLASLRAKLKEAQGKAAAAEAELPKRDQRIKELQTLVKTLGERLNDLADRPR